LRILQEEAISYVDKGFSVLAVLPTGLGKTAIGIYSAIKAKREGFKTALITPLKALSKEHFQTFSYFDLTAQVFDSDTNTNLTELADINIFTAERYDSLIRKSKNHQYIKQLEYLIIDEIHMINGNRGYCIESLIFKTKLINHNIKLIGLSATVGDISNLVQFLGAIPIVGTDKDRPVKLVEKIVNYVEDDKLHLLKNDLTKPAIVFCSSRAKTTELCEYISGLKYGKEIEKHIYEFLELGYGFHNAGLSKETRELVEKTTREKTMKALFATSTLQAGVNFLQFKKVIVYDTLRYSMLRGEELISSEEIRQQGGRARGEEGKDEYVEAIYYVRNDKHYSFIENFKFKPIQSNMCDYDNLKKLVLEIIVSEIAVRKDEIIRKIIENCMKPIPTKELICEAIEELTKRKLIYYKNNKDICFIPSFVGKMCIYLYIEIDTALHLYDGCFIFPKDNLIVKLLKILDCREFKENVIVRKEDNENIDRALKYLVRYNISDIDVKLLKCFYLLFRKEIEKSLNDKLKIYFVESDYMILRESAKRILFAASVICNDSIKKDAIILTEMLVNGELNKDKALVRMIKGIGSVRMEKLSNANIHKITDFVNVSNSALSDILKLKESVIEDMKKKARELILEYEVVV
jgi:helicase